MSCCTHKIHRSRDRVIFGVCQGFSDHFDLPVVWLRLGWVILAAITFPVAIIAYFVIAFILKPADEPRPEAEFDDNFYDTDMSSRTIGLRRLKSKFDAIEARIRRMENYVTNKSYDWERRFNAGK